VSDIEIGFGKSGRRAYGFDDIAIIPSRRTRDPEDVDVTWQIDAYRFDLPLMAAAMDGVVSPATAIAVGRLGGVGVLNLFGALRSSMATCGYVDIKEFQKAEVMVAPALQTEGKSLQRSQGVGMGR